MKGNPLVVGALGYAYAACGDKRQSLVVLRRLENQAREQYPRAFRWLEKAYEDRDGQIDHINEETLLDGLRSDHRFTELLRRMGLPH